MLRTADLQVDSACLRDETDRSVHAACSELQISSGFYELPVALTVAYKFWS